MPPKQNLPLKSRASQFDALTLAMSDDDDDFQNPVQAVSLTQNLILSSFDKPNRNPSSQPLKPSNGVRSSKKPKHSIGRGKENFRVPPVLDSKRDHISTSVESTLLQESTNCSSRVEKDCFKDDVCTDFDLGNGCKSETRCLSNWIESSLPDSSTDCFSRVHNGYSNELGFDEGVSAEKGEDKGFKSGKSYSLASIESRLLESNMSCISKDDDDCLSEHDLAEDEKRKEFKLETGCLSNSIESRLLASRTSYSSGGHDGSFDHDSIVDFEPGTQLNVLMELCSEMGYEEDSSGVDFQEENVSSYGLVKCPLCEIDISDLNEELRLIHTNNCLDKEEIQKVVPPTDNARHGSPKKIVDVSPVLEWLRNLGLSRYEEAFVREEIDWDTLQWLTEEDLFSIGVTALGPRKKIVHVLNELRKGNKLVDGRNSDASKISIDESKKLAGNKLITEYFPGFPVVDGNRDCSSSRAQCGIERSNTKSTRKRVMVRNPAKSRKVRDIPSWCCIPGTPFRVDAFRYLRGDCSHWFLTHFHTDHYQGLTRTFSQGKVYCSSITAQLVNMKIGIPWERLQVLPLNQKISIAGVDLTCFDANHCPGSIIILFEPPNGKAVLHTGDFRFSEEMTNISILQSCSIQTLILDTTYCNPQYDFPKQEAVIQFVIEAIQAEAFNPKTLFLIGSYTIGKERLFLEVARCLRKKVYVGAAKLRLLECLGISQEDMQWFTLNEQESHIHVVPMWTIASFKRMKQLSNQYSGRFNLIVAFSPTGWTFGKGKKKSPGRRWQQGTIIRYEVPYSEHCSFTELKEFVQFISPENIIPSVNNNGPESADAMIALLMS